ncbi:DUF885 domain-containing protein [Agromyces sp. ZXT2-3]|uniref:DUF885 domain-containing protein n=1 Tax=Agromyces sp. ZXT2-3 TaxID=3461152 RepID=UPI004054C4BC
MAIADRTPTDVDRIAEEWVDTIVELNPTVGTYLGRTDQDHRLPDFSPDGHEARIEAARAARAALGAASATDDVDRITVADLDGELGLDLEADAAGLQLRDLNVIASPAQEVREVFDLMPTADEEDWARIASRLAAVPAAIDGYVASLRLGIERGIVPAVRQVHEVAVQARRHARPDGFFASFVGGAGEVAGEALRHDLDAGAAAAASAYGRLAEFLDGELAPRAGERDAVGREIYALRSRHFLGAVVDLDETYEWGVEELARMVAEQEAVANEVLPGASVEEAVAHLEADPARKLVGTDALQRWMQETSDRAVAELGATQFDIPEEIRTLECRIAPTQEGGIYYTGPSDDFTRPGRMWWSVPEGVTEFDAWREKTTVYHEGVPGHHLQIGQAVANRRQLNTWRRQLAGTSGHAEGWALYAERLMQELGYLDDPADRLGMLDGQRMRAARVVLDIGVHLGKPRPDGDGTWTGEYAFDFMGRNVNMPAEFVRFEVHRYLGWPGQAPSYKVGQRIWEQLRADVQRREGAGFDVRSFHRRALSLGGVGLDTLRGAMAA